MSNVYSHRKLNHKRRIICIFSGDLIKLPCVLALQISDCWTNCRSVATSPVYPHPLPLTLIVTLLAKYQRNRPQR